jgi:hypothetical protein
VSQLNQSESTRAYFSSISVDQEVKFVIVEISWVGHMSEGNSMS